VSSARSRSRVTRPTPNQSIVDHAYTPDCAPAGSVPVQIDPVGGHLFLLLGPQAGGTFTNMEQRFSFSFN
jgi:hypothetical protein